MKKIFMFLALVLGAVSCQDNLEGLDVNVNGEKGYINVSLAEETRADSAFGFDLSSLTTDTEHELRYILEIYPENTDKVYRDVRYSDNTSVSFPVSIVAGQKYTFAVWADIVAEDANRASDADADLYYETSNGLKSISIIDANWNAMDEKRDAFTGHATLETGDLSEVNSITLTRPFAKLRVVTNDIESATEPKSAKVTYTQSVYTQFDATTGTASNAKNKVHTYKTFPYTDKEGEMTLFADYLLVTETFATKFDIDVFSDDNYTTSIKQNSFDTEISLVRNKVTTIKGSILTDGNITNTLKPANNEIWYTNGSTTEATTPYKTDVFGANIVSNTYDAEKECWVIKFDGDVTEIGLSAFFNCDSITSVTIPDSVISIGDSAFESCSRLTSVTIPDSVTTIERSAFISCTNLKSITIPDSVISIGDSAFNNCSELTSVTIPNSVKMIGELAFRNCSNLTSVTIGEGVEVIGATAFYACSNLTSITIPNSVTSIESQTFRLCRKLTSVTIPNSITSIGNYAFYYCDSLTSVTIPNSVTSIGASAFNICSSLTSVYCEATTPPTGNNYMFRSNASNRKIYVPAESVAAYKSADYWSEYADDIVGYDFENGVVVTPKPANNEIWYTTSNGQAVELYSGEYIFGANVVSNTYVDGKGVIKLDGNATKLQEAFENDEYLLTVTLPDSVTELNDAAFSGCPNLHTINFGNGIETAVTSGTSRPIINCPALSKFEGSIASEDGRCVICNGELFYVVGLEGLTSYTLPEGITSMNAVLSSTTLTQLTLPNSLTSIYLNTRSIPALSSFAGACASGDGSCVIINGELLYFAPMALSSTTSYTVDSRVTKIASAFPTSSTLETVTFPSGCTEVTTRLFGSCANIESVQGSIASTDGKCVVVNNTLIELIDKKLTSYTIPAGITEIGANAFERGAITSITVPASVTKIGNNAFSNSNTSSIYFKSTIPAEITSLYNQWVIDDDIVLYVPAESVAAYKASWSEYASIIVGYDFENGMVVTPKPANNEIWYTATAMVEPNSENAFGANIKSNVWDEITGNGIITFDGEVSIIGNRAFNSVYSNSPGRNLTSITLPSSVTKIDDYAFYGCSGLTTIEMQNVKTIGQYSFYSCTGLVDIVIPDTVTSIEYASFAKCSNLISITISKNISNIGRNAFESCTSLKDCYCKSTTPPSFGGYVFLYNATGRKIYVPAESVAAYKSADGWKDYAADIVGYNFETGEIVE